MPQPKERANMKLMPPIVSLTNALREYPTAIFCDVRYALDGSNGYEAYLRGHIPGSRYVSMDQVLASPPGPVVGRHPLPSPQDFAENLGKLGIENDSVVIAYDAVGGRFAGRLVWMLRIIGQSAALLDGGLQSWSDCMPEIPLETAPPKWRACERVMVPWPKDSIVTADQVQQAIAEGVLVVDARAPERYRGDVEPIDRKAGHIPGAKNLFLGGNYEAGGNYFKSTDELSRRFQEAGFDSDTICYCGSGVTACNNVLAAEAAGLPRPRVYVGSWSGWSSDDSRPVATGND
jgi:thiosulfate/3-mercaptopyruvate sulfurtransferase